MFNAVAATATAATQFHPVALANLRSERESDRFPYTDRRFVKYPFVGIRLLSKGITNQGK